MRYFVLFLAFSVVATAQNPDGKGFSLHITPYYSFGSSDLLIQQSVPRYSSSGSIIGYTTSSTSSGLTKQSGFSFNILAKFPVNDNFTFSTYLSSYSERPDNPPSVGAYYNVNTTKNIKTIGGTLSIYFWKNRDSN